MASALYIAWKQFDARQETAHASHVIVAIPSDAVANAIKDQHPVTKLFQRLQDGSYLELVPSFFGPEPVFYRSVRREDKNDSLLAIWFFLIGRYGLRQTESQQCGGTSGLSCRCQESATSNGGNGVHGCRAYLFGLEEVDGVVFSQPLLYGGRTLMRIAGGGKSFNTAWAITVRSTEGIPRYDDRFDEMTGLAGSSYDSTSYALGPASGDDPPRYPVSGHRKSHE